MVRPANGYVLALPLPLRSSIILPRSSFEKVLFAKVLDIGNAVLDIDIGDTVVFPKRAPFPLVFGISVGEQKHLLVDEDTVMLVLREDK